MELQESQCLIMSRAAGLAQHHKKISKEANAHNTDHAQAIHHPFMSQI